jgi:predicted Zn finger-like uncharacterized protein
MILNCPHCENEFYIHDELAGVTVNCHKCKKPVEAPAKTVVTVEESGSVTEKDTMPRAPKAETHLKTEASVKPYKHKRLTLCRGFRRLTLLVSVLLGPLIFLSEALRGDYTLNNYPIFIHKAFGLFKGLKLTLGVAIAIEYALFWLAGFVVVWAIYGLLWFVATGFYDAGEQTSEQEN